MDDATRLAMPILPFPTFDDLATVPYGVHRVPPRVEGCLIVADGKVVAAWNGWYSPDHQDFHDYLEREGIAWKSFTVIGYASEPGIVRHRLVCGSVKPEGS